MKTDNWITEAAKAAAKEFPRAFNGNLGNLARLPDTLERIIAAHVPGWQPIETAPKDREIVVTAWANGTPNTERFYAIVKWVELSQGWETDESYGPIHTPTHWLPLPPPPSATNEKA